VAALAPGPTIELSRIVAVATVHGPATGSEQLAAAADPALSAHHRFHAVHGHLLEMNDDRRATKAYYLAAAGSTLNLAEQYYLRSRAAALD
jgi:predicted RNA polymerase sigma factor